MHRLSAFSIIRLFIRTPSILCFILFCDTAIAARISGKVVDVQGSPVANLTVHADDPVQGCQFCSTVAVVNTDAQGNFEFELPALRYVLFAFVPPPYTIPRYLADARDGDVTGIQLVIDKTRRPLYPDIPPNAQLINLGTPNAIGETEVTGQAGSVLPSSVVILVNLDTGHLGHTTADKNGAFNATLIAFPGNSVVVKADPLGYAAHTWLFFSPPEKVGGNDQLTTIPGTVLHMPHPDGFTGPTGTADAGLAKHQYKETDQEPPAWVFTGKSNRVDFSPGDTLNIQGRFELVSPALSGTASADCAVFLVLELISRADGTGASSGNTYASTFLTPTGLPIEREDGIASEGLSKWHGFTYTRSGSGPLEAEIDVNLELPKSIPAGYYKPFLYHCVTDVPEASPPSHHMTGLETFFDDFFKVALPIIKVGNPQPPRLYLTLLTDAPSNGTRGTVALEDAERFSLSPRILTQSKEYIIPRQDLNGDPISYRLEPFAPLVSSGDRTPPRSPKIPFKFPSGNLAVSIKRPDGTVKTINPAPFVQSRVNSVGDPLGWVLGTGGGNITDLYQISTMEPRFEVQFDQDGLHVITMQAEIDDIWGNRWTGGGTYEVHVARTLVLDTAVLPGTPFEVGDNFLAGVTLSPAVPASVEAKLTLVVNSDPGKSVVRTVKGTANRFGQFIPEGPGLVFDQPGEYRFDIKATWTDGHGRLWMGSRTWGGVVAPTDTDIIAHARRGADSSPEIGPAWYHRDDPGITPGGHMFMPFFSGDVEWVINAESIVTSMSFDDPQGKIADLISSRAGDYFAPLKPPGTIDERIAVGSVPLISSRPEYIDPHFDPGKVDLWAYSYRSVQRPLVRVREIISEDWVDSPYWRFDEAYGGQVGIGYLGDMPNDIKFQYGGVVLRGSALSKPHYAIYGSLAAIVPDNDVHGGSRVFPPFQGNGGGPNGGPLITFKGKDIDLFINMGGVRPGSIMTVGDTFAMSGAIGPTLPGKISYTVTRPDGSKLTFNYSGQRKGNLVGYYYQPQDNFTLDQAGVWTVDLEVMFDGRTSGGQLTPPFPTGDVLGSENGRFHFYVTDDGEDLLPTSLPEHSEADSQMERYKVDIQGLLPAGLTVLSAHVTTMMPGTILESRDLGASLLYRLNLPQLAADVPNLDMWAGRGDHLTTSIFVEAKDAQGNLHHLGRVVNFHGPDVYSLDVPAPTAESFAINAGHAGAWYNPVTPGQGQLIDIEPAGKFVFLSWFTYTDDASANPNEQHWLTAQGNFSGDTAQLAVYETLGGQFDDPKATSTSPVGTLELSFSDCATGQANYTIDSWGVAGSFPLSRAVPGTENVCLDRTGNSGPALVENDGWDGAWYDAATPGQGFLIDVLPNPGGDDFIFVAWFTYGENNVSGQRWLTAQGPMTGTAADIPVYETTGGSFDDPKATGTAVAGSMTIEFTGCNSALVTYALSDGGLAGSIDIQRAIPGTEALCQELR